MPSLIESPAKLERWNDGCCFRAGSKTETDRFGKCCEEIGRGRSVGQNEVMQEASQDFEIVTVIYLVPSCSAAWRRMNNE